MRKIALCAVWFVAAMMFQPPFVDAAHDRKPVPIDNLTYARLARLRMSVVVVKSFIENTDGKKHDGAERAPRTDSENGRLVKPYLTTTVLDTRAMGLRAADIGTGFICAKEGLRIFVCTNAHVVRGGIEIVVQTAGKKEYRARVIEVDSKRDGAVLELIPGVGFAEEEFSVLSFGDSDTVALGEAVMSIGHPGKNYFSVQRGIISAARFLYASGQPDPQLFIQLDAPTGLGASGSPIFTLDGEVVGVIALMETNPPFFGFAIPGNDFIKMIEKAKTKIDGQNKK